MRSLFVNCWFFLLFATAHHGNTQSILQIKGRVLDADTKEPLPQCNVYLNNSTFGTTTNNEGYFELANIPTGGREVVFSFVGYVTEVVSITSQAFIADSPLLINLVPRKELLGEVEIKSKREKGWQKRYRRFEDLFLGTDEIGQMSQILNPGVIDIEERFVRSAKGLQVAPIIQITTARADVPITIVNRATGYKIEFDMEEFEHSDQQFKIAGNTRFTLLEAETRSDSELWEANRLNIYTQSPEYLFRLLVLDQHEDLGFTLLHPANNNIPQENLTGDDYTVSFSHAKQVAWDSANSRYQIALGESTLIFSPSSTNNTKAERKSSILEVKGGNIYISPDFKLINPYDITLQGALANKYVNRLLPFDYVPLNQTALKVENIRPEIIEKVYLHLDKPHYFPGDTIWFKAYAFQANVSPDEEPLYVELFDGKTATPLISKTIRLSQGLGYGEIAIPDSINNQHITIRAYTQWMLNFEDDFVFYKDLPVFARGFLQTSKTDREDNIDVQFLPEGGELIDRIQSRVAFKGIDNTGRGIDINGFIVNQRGDTVVNFQSTHLGMGSFFFTPIKSDVYKAFARTGSSQYRQYELPLIEASGFALQIDNISSEKEIKVYVQTNANNTSGNTKLVLVASTAETTVVQTEFDITVEGRRLTIPKKDLGSGILAIRLQTTDSVTISERLVYLLSKERHIALEAKTEQKKFAPREEMTIEVSLATEGTRPASGNFSIAVTDAMQVIHPKHQENIVSYHYLTSQLKGNIEQPARYFDPTNVNAKIELDLVMLTHGWRMHRWRTKYNQILRSPKLLPQTGLSITGVVTKTNEKEVDESQLITLMINPLRQGVTQVIDGKTDTVGNFSFHNLEFYDSVGIFVQSFQTKVQANGSEKLKRSNQIQLHPRDIPTFTPRLLPSLIFDQQSVYTDYDDYIVEIDRNLDLQKQYSLNNDIMMAGVTIRAKKSQVGVDFRDVQYGGNPSYRFEVSEQFYSFQNVFHLLRGRYPGVTVVGNVFGLDGNGLPPSVIIRGQATSINLGIGAQILLDGQPVDANLVLNIPVEFIEKIDILKGFAANAIFGAAGSGGTINILTKQGNPLRAREYDYRQNLGNIGMLMEGYHVPQLFYVPKFNPDIPPALQTDYRSTVYWQPIVSPDDDGKIRITFPLTDGSKVLKVIVEGWDTFHRPIHTSLDVLLEE